MHLCEFQTQSLRFLQNHAQDRPCATFSFCALVRCMIPAVGVLSVNCQRSCGHAFMNTMQSLDEHVRFV